MNATICGLDRTALIWALTEPKNLSAAQLEWAHEHEGECVQAMQVVHDPAKVAELTAAALRERGVSAQLRLLVKEGEWPDVEILYFPNEYNRAASPKLGFYVRPSGRNFDMTMPQARAAAQRILMLPEGATDADAMKALGVP